MKNPAATPEPPPVHSVDGVEVWPVIIGIAEGSCPELVPYMRARHEFGVAKYGCSLRTNNGRNALVDLLQEILDAIAYATQCALENDGPLGDQAAQLSGKIGLLAVAVLDVIDQRDLDQADSLETVVDVAVRLRGRLIERYLAAWCAQTGVLPDDAVLLSHGSAGATLSVERRSSINALENAKAIGAAVDAVNAAYNARVQCDLDTPRVGEITDKAWWFDEYGRVKSAENAAQRALLDLLGVRHG